jgi:hypothetical protein
VAERARGEAEATVATGRFGHRVSRSVRARLATRSAAGRNKVCMSFVPSVPGVACERRVKTCMRVVLCQRKKGFPALVSLIVCLPTRRKRGSSVGSSLSVALPSSNPRGPNLLWNSGFLG